MPIVHALILACCFVGGHPARWAGVNLGLAAADYETAHANQSPALRAHCVESNPLFGSAHPSRAAFYGRGLPLDFAIEASGYLIWRSIPADHPRLRAFWMAPFAAISYSHARGIASNLTCR